jgi:hypothetical protein
MTIYNAHINQFSENLKAEQRIVAINILTGRGPTIRYSVAGNEPSQN